MSSQGYRTILIFSKSAEKGKVKTRLQGALGAEACLALHLAFLKDTIATCRSLRETDVTLYLSGPESLPFAPPVPVRYQSKGDLGIRMQKAFETELKNYEKVVIVGTDCPALTKGRIEDAFQELESHDCVLGPSTDGGYYLIGLRKILPEIFEGIPWSTSRVLETTLQRAPNAALIRPAYDVDEPAHLEHMIAEAASGAFPHASHLAEWISNRR